MKYGFNRTLVTISASEGGSILSKALVHRQISPSRALIHSWGAFH